MLICGIDEAGRGPLAGPVTAAAVILPDDFPEGILDDSKKLNEKKRSIAAELIKEKAAAWSLGWVWPEEIDLINIHYASLLAMHRAYSGLKIKADYIYIDGKFTFPAGTPAEAVTGGDGKISQIMAASILAKTSRDSWMTEYALTDSRYGFDKHKGYPVKAHYEAIKKWGICPIHRKSFRLYCF